MTNCRSAGNARCWAWRWLESARRIHQASAERLEEWPRSAERAQSRLNFVRKVKQRMLTVTLAPAPFTLCNYHATRCDDTGCNVRRPSRRAPRSTSCRWISSMSALAHQSNQENRSREAFDKPPPNDRYLRTAAIDTRQTISAFPMADLRSREPIGRFRLSGLQRPVLDRYGDRYGRFGPTRFIRATTCRRRASSR
jgi:hypothetical protein